MCVWWWGLDGVGIRWGGDMPRTCIFAYIYTCIFIYLIMSGADDRKATSSDGSTPVVRAVVYASATGAALALLVLVFWLRFDVVGVR